MFWTLYWWACVGVWVGYFYLSYMLGGPDRALNAVAGVISHSWASTNDPVLNILVGLLSSVVALILVPGFLVIGFYLIVAVLALALAVYLVEGLIWLADSVQREPLSRHHRRASCFLDHEVDLAACQAVSGRIAEALFGVFFDWWVHPLWLQWKGKRLMGKSQAKKAELVREYQNLQIQFPEIAGIPLAGSYDGWAAQVYQRFQGRQIEKTYAQQAKTVEAQKNVLERVKQLFN